MRFTQRASYFMDGRVCGFKMRSGIVLYWSPHVVTIRLFFAVWPRRMQGDDWYLVMDATKDGLKNAQGYECSKTTTTWVRAKK